MMRASLARLLRRVGACTACPTLRGYRKFAPAAHGRVDARFMLVGEAPGIASIDHGRQWTGAGGMVLRREIRRLGLDLEDLFYLTNAVKCWPRAPGRRPANRSPLRSEAVRCAPFLAREIALLDPEVIVAVGAVAARAVSGVPVRLPDDHGRRVSVDGREVIVLLHPANASRHRAVWPTYRRSLLLLFAELAARAGFPVEEVVAGVVARDGRYLVAQRAGGRHLAGLWEFPGGKRKTGEPLTDALRRELHEELGVVARVGGLRLVVPWTYPEKTVVLYFFDCDIGDQAAEAREGQPLRWVTPAELPSLAFPPADGALVADLAHGEARANDNRHFGERAPDGGAPAPRRPEARG
jgi:uracil-DNA glycosylase family 4/mutator protein MutT